MAPPKTDNLSVHHFQCSSFLGDMINTISANSGAETHHTSTSCRVQVVSFFPCLSSLQVSSDCIGSLAAWLSVSLQEDFILLLISNLHSFLHTFLFARSLNILRFLYVWNARATSRSLFPSLPDLLAGTSNMGGPKTG